MRIGVDVGGTFTDAVLIDGASLWTAKSPTTANFVDGVLSACELAARRAGKSLAQVLPEVSRFGLGTTAVTNAITSRRGLRVGLLITKGFEETLHISRGHVVAEDLRLSHGFEVVDLEDIVGIDERIDRHGAVLKPLDTAEVEAAVERLVAQGIQALAVSFLWSIVDPAHEAAAAEAIARRWPDLPVTIGSRLLPVPREYERTTLAVLNAYVSAACTGVEELGRRLSDGGLAAPLLLVHSGGGTISVAETRARPVWLAESGPAAGVMAAAATASRSGAAKAISCDMGGTSFDVSDMAGESPSRITRGELMGIWTALPRVDVESIGAGGGSIAWIDARRMLRVGPQSAGSRPGPACYGHGGTQPAVTDALVVLDYIDAANFLGGDMRLDRAAAVNACAAVGAPLGLDAEEAAWGIRGIALAEMTKAVRTRLAMRGLDPRDHALVSFGGCASLFTADIAKALSAPAVIVPAAASVLSALGAATMGMRRERVCSVLKAMPVAVAELASLGCELASQVDADLAADGVPAADRRVSLEADLRFVRQTWELSIPLEDIAFDESFEAALRGHFEEEYTQRYGAGSISMGMPLEVVALRAVGTGPADGGLAVLPTAAETPLEPIVPTRSRLVRSGAEPSARIRVGVIEDSALQFGRTLPGPALIERWDTSIWIPEAVTARRDQSGSIILEVS